MSPPSDLFARSRRRLRLEDLYAPGLAGLLAVVAWVLRWRGGDLPAQLYRIGLFRSKGFALWNDQWYGGHYTVGYSILLQVLGSILGATLLGATSAVVAAWAFDRLVRGWLGDRALAASLWFAAGTVVNLAVGRLSFAMGLAFGLLALLALARGRPVVGVVLALLTGLASPVAGAFIALAAGAHAVGTAYPIRSRGGVGEARVEVRVEAIVERWRHVAPSLAMSAMALLPVGVFALLFPEGGTFPFTVGALCAVLGFALAVWWSVDNHIVRTGAVLYGLVALAVFVIPNPLGGNLSRLGMMFVAPLVLCGVHRPKRLGGIALLAGLAWWQWSPAIDAISGGAARDPSATAGYYTGLLGYLGTQPGPVRIEIPVTKHHWEVERVAPTVGLARGWERQIDIADNQLFYRPTLDAWTYSIWLRNSAVGFVALPDAALDRSSSTEAVLLRDGVKGLDLVWSNDHWKVWRVADALPLVSGPARLASLDVSSFSLAVASPGDVTVRVRYTPHWKVRPVDGCVGPTSEGWTMVRVARPGTVVVRTSLSNQLLSFADRAPGICTSG